MCPHARPDWRMCPHCNGINSIPACPDCGSPMNVNEEREIGRMIRKEEIAMMFEGTPEEYAALPNDLGRTVGEWNKTETCTQCHYEARNGHVVKRGGKKD